MRWCDFYDGYMDWADSTRRTRISSLEDIGPGDEIVEVVLEIHDEKIRAQLINKAIKLGAEFTRDDFADLDGELSAQQYEILGKYAGYDYEDPYFDEDNMDWDDFCNGYPDWDDWILTRRLSKLKDFGPAEEVCEVISNMPTYALEKLLYRKAAAAGVKFSRGQVMEMGHWDDVLYDITIQELSDENIDRFVEKVKPVVEEAAYIVEHQDEIKRKTKRENRRFIALAAVMGFLGGIAENQKKKRKKR